MSRIYEAARKLVEAQRARGLEPQLALRVGVPLRDRHHFALRLAELGGANLRAAQALLRDGQVVWESLAPGLAMAAAVQIERAGGQVELELGRIERLAFDPGHPARGDQVCERLILCGRELSLARGPLAGPVATTTLIRKGHASQLFAGFERERGRWAAAGLAEAEHDAALLARVGAREPNLEAALARARGAALVDHAEIYGDWLQAHGDPRGLVASASLAAARAGDLGPRRAALEALAELVTRHRAHLLGGLAPALSPAALTWLGPMVYRATLTASTTELARARPRELATGPSSALADIIELDQLAHVDALVQLERVLALPVAASLRELELGDGFASHPRVPSTLAGAPCATTLERLDLRGLVDARLGGGSAAPSGLGSAFARLRRLALTGVRGELACAIRLPALRRLQLEFVDTWPDLPASFAGLDAPRLIELELALVDERGRLGGGSISAGLADLLAQPSFARVRRLTLGRRGPARFEGLAQLLAISPAAATLERVDVRRAGLSDAALAELRQRLPRAEIVG